MLTERDYRLGGEESQLAKDKGLVSAEWYKCDIPRAQMKELMRRRDAPGLIDTAIWFALILVSAALVILSWGTWWAVVTVFLYSTILGGGAASRWHESGHGTMFRTRWLNDVLYQFSCFFLNWEPTLWRWSHARHHTDTYIIGRDREILAERPPNLAVMVLDVVNLVSGVRQIGKVLWHAIGRTTIEDRDLIPDQEFPKLFRVARIWVALWFLIAALSLYYQTWIFFVLFVVPQFLGHWFVLFCAVTQHVGLDEDILDHRLNTRTIYMNRAVRFLYNNMNYHIEHHMFPMVPFHSLEQLHELVKHDCPPPYPNLIVTYKEILATLWRQRKEPDYFVRRSNPSAARARDA